MGADSSQPEPSSRATAHAVEVIERNAEAQIRLIEEVLDVSRIITGKMTLASEPGRPPADASRRHRQRPSRHAGKTDSDRGTASTKCRRWSATDTGSSRCSGTSCRTRVKFTGDGGTITVTARARCPMRRVRDRRHRRRHPPRRAALRLRSLPSGGLVDEADPTAASAWVSRIVRHTWSCTADPCAP